MRLSNFCSFTYLGRLALLVTLFLVQVQVIKDIQTILPTSNSLPGISVYALASLLFILVALIEYTFILMLVRCKDRSPRIMKKMMKFDSDKLDSVMIVLFFVSAFFFNVMYIFRFNVL